MEGDGTLLNGIGGNVSDDVASSFLEPPEKRSSADDEDEKEGRNVSDDRIRVLHPKNLETEVLLPERSDLQPTLASADLENEFADIDRKMKAAVDSKNYLEDHMSDLEGAKFLKKECLDLFEMFASSPNSTVKYSLMNLMIFFPTTLRHVDARPKVGRRMKARGDKKNNTKDLARHLMGGMATESEADNFLKECELRLVRELCFKAEQRSRALMKKKEVVNTLNEMLKESLEEVEAVIKKPNYSVANHKEAMASLKSKARKLSVKLTMDLMEHVVIFFIELLVAMPEKKEMMMILKKGLMLAKEILKCRNNKLEEELKQLEYHASILEQRTEMILSGYEDGGFLQNKRRMEKPKKVDKGLNFEGTVALALVGTLIMHFVCATN